MRTAGYVIAALLAAAAFYLASPHQALLRGGTFRPATLRIIGFCLLMSSLFAGAHELGTWPGIFAALTACMLGCVAFPYLDAWRANRGGDTHVD